MTDFAFDQLRRRPDIEAPELVAVDATDRLLLDEAAPLLAGLGEGEVAVVGDRYGALTLGAVALHGVRQPLVHQDLLTGRRALDLNAEAVGLAGTYRPVPLEPDAFRGVRVVLLQLPRSLDTLDEIVGAVAAGAPSDVVVLAGGRLKHMTRAMNDVLRRHFGSVEARLARQKSRVLVARDPQPAADDVPAHHRGPGRWPAVTRHVDLDLEVHAHGGVFSGTRVDPGTRLLLDRLTEMAPTAEAVVDLACGSGIVAALLARSRPGATVLATDDSAAAVASARATAAANGLGDRIDVRHDDALSSVEDGGADLVVLNPPFHAGAAVHTGIATKLFADAARALRPGGELWVVWNSHLRYRPQLEAVVGPTRQVARTPTFTVTMSTRR